MPRETLTRHPNCSTGAEKVTIDSSFGHEWLSSDTGYEKDPMLRRFCIIDSAMRFLFYAYHSDIKERLSSVIICLRMQ